MKKLLLYTLISVIVFSCSKDEAPVATKKYTVSISVSTGGNVSATGGAYDEGYSFSVTATPNTNYVFSGWSNGSTDNPLVVTANSNQSIVANFTKKKYELSVTTVGGGTVTEEVISTGKEYDSGTVLKLTANSSLGWGFSGWTGAVVSNENPIQLTINEAKSITANFEELIMESISIINPLDTLVISKKHKFQVEGTYTNGDKIDLTNLVQLEKMNDKVTLLGNNEFTVGKSGETSIKVKYEGKEEMESFYSYEIEYVDVNSEFISNDNCGIRVPIVVLNLFPTTDGVLHDDASGPSNYWEIQNPELDKTKQKVKEDLIVSKKIVEYGTRFRDFGSEVVNPYICVDVVKYINVYSWEKVNWVNNQKTLNYHELFQRLNMENYVNNLGVKEIWITHFPKDAYPSIVNSEYNDSNTFWGIPESNMSSPFTGDISNSYRFPNDLPIYQNTYVVYGNSGHRGVDTNIHNRGHQIESQLRYIEKERMYNKELFWNLFVGVKDGAQKQNGRCGNTHFPPNAENDYEYCQPNSIESDIMNWTPQGGEKIIVGCNTWTDIQYNFEMRVQNVNDIADYNKDPQTKWLLYWFQSIPGHNNNIPYVRDGVNYTITNWWDLFYNWDEAISQNKNLWK